MDRKALIKKYEQVTIAAEKAFQAYHNLRGRQGLLKELLMEMEKENHEGHDKRTETENTTANKE